MKHLLCLGIATSCFVLGIVLMSHLVSPCACVLSCVLCCVLCARLSCVLSSLSCVCVCAAFAVLACPGLVCIVGEPIHGQHGRLPLSLFPSHALILRLFTVAQLHQSARRCCCLVFVLRHAALCKRAAQLKRIRQPMLPPFAPLLRVCLLNLLACSAPAFVAFSAASLLHCPPALQHVTNSLHRFAQLVQQGAQVKLFGEYGGMWQGAG